MALLLVCVQGYIYQFAAWVATRVMKQRGLWSDGALKTEDIWCGQGHHGFVKVRPGRGGERERLLWSTLTKAKRNALSLTSFKIEKKQSQKKNWNLQIMKWHLHIPAKRLFVFWNLRNVAQAELRSVQPRFWFPIHSISTEEMHWQMYWKLKTW